MVVGYCYDYIFKVDVFKDVVYYFVGFFYYFGFEFWVVVVVSSVGWFEVEEYEVVVFE